MSLYNLVGGTGGSLENAASDSHLETIGTENYVSKRYHVVCFVDQMCVGSDTDDSVFNQTNSVKWISKSETKDVMGCGRKSASVVTTRLKRMDGFMCCLLSTII